MSVVPSLKGIWADVKTTGSEQEIVSAQLVLNSKEIGAILKANWENKQILRIFAKLARNNVNTNWAHYQATLR